MGPSAGILSTGKNSVLSRPHWTENRYLRGEVPILRGFHPLHSAKLETLMFSCSWGNNSGFVYLLIDGAGFWYPSVGNSIRLQLEDFFPFSVIYIAGHFTGDETSLPQQGVRPTTTVPWTVQSSSGFGAYKNLRCTWQPSPDCWRVKGCVSSCLGTRITLDHTTICNIGKTDLLRVQQNY